MAAAFDPEVLNKLHERLLAGDRTASKDLLDLVLVFISEETARKFPRMDKQLVWDGVVDALLDYCEKPTRFASDGSLEGFLLTAAWRNAANLFKGEQRRKQRQQKVAAKKMENDIADDPAARSIRQEEEKKRAEEVSRLLACLDDPIDREFAKLQFSGARKAEEFARLLGIEQLTIGEQRKIVKQNKDRIRALLKRKGRRT